MGSAEVVDEEIIDDEDGNFNTITVTQQTTLADAQILKVWEHVFGEGSTKDPVKVLERAKKVVQTARPNSHLEVFDGELVILCKGSLSISFSEIGDFIELTNIKSVSYFITNFELLPFAFKAGENGAVMLRLKNGRKLVEAMPATQEKIKKTQQLMILAVFKGAPKLLSDLITQLHGMSNQLYAIKRGSTQENDLIEIKMKGLTEENADLKKKLAEIAAIATTDDKTG